MMQFIATLAICAVPFFLLFGLACSYWNDHNRTGAIGYAVVVVVATMLWQGVWDMTGGVG